MICLSVTDIYSISPLIIQMNSTTTFTLSLESIEYYLWQSYYCLTFLFSFALDIFLFHFICKICFQYLYKCYCFYSFAMNQLIIYDADEFYYNIYFIFRIHRILSMAIVLLLDVFIFVRFRYISVSFHLQNMFSILVQMLLFLQFRDESNAIRIY